MSSLCIRTARLGVLELEPTGRHRGVHLNAGTDQVHPELSDGGLTSFTHFCQIPQGLLKVCFPELVSPLSLNCPLSFPTECPGAPSSRTGQQAAVGTCRLLFGSCRWKQFVIFPLAICTKQTGRLVSL